MDHPVSPASPAGMRLATEDRAFARKVLIVAAVAGLIGLVWLTSSVLLLGFASILVAVLFRGLADVIAGHTPVPHRWSLTVAVLAVALLSALFLVLFGSQLLGQLSSVAKDVPEALRAAGERLGIDNVDQVVRDAVSSASRASVLSRAAGIGYTVLGGIADLALVLVAGIYLAASPDLYRQGSVKLLPKDLHGPVLDAMSVTGTALRLWFAGQLVTMAIVGVASGLLYSWIGLPSPLALAIIAGVTNFIPFLGPIIGAVPALVLATTTDMTTVLWTIAAILAVQQLEGNVVTPMIQKRAVALPPVVVLFAIVVFGLIFGWPGMILAVPLSVAVSVFVKKFWIRGALGESTTVPGEAGQTPMAGET